MSDRPAHPARLRVVLFSGGRGSGALTSQLVANPRVQLTVAINGYDDGASTGEVRRFLGDSLGPSDFRKNASRLARLLGTAPASLIDLLDLRLPDTLSGPSVADEVGRALSGSADGHDSLMPVRTLSSSLPESLRAALAERLGRFAGELASSAAPFSFADCSLGNLVFAGGFLLHTRDFNAAVDDYARLVGLPGGLVENVTDGADAHLVAVDAGGRLLGSEEE
ncbi:MAG: 2-phospho-L-lactate transferase CofD family protein, partial [Vicinamibacterales bacterium]